MIIDYHTISTTRGNKMITDKQREERKLGIGGSDLAIILGLSNYMTPYQLYLDKIGEGEIREETEQQYWGNRIEPLIRQEFEIRNNVKVEERETIIHPMYDFLRGNLDGFIPELNAVLEVKCSNSFMSHEWGEDGSDVIPMQYLVQVAHYCAITNAESAFIAVLIGGNQYRQFKYTRDLELEMHLIEAARKFWECVVNRTPPDATNLTDLRIMFPNHIERKSVTVNEDVKEHVSKLFNTRLQKKALEDVEEKTKFNIMQFMTDSEVLLDDAGKELISWKTNKRGSRTFLIKGI